MGKCELCEEKKITKCYFENEDWLIIDCKICNIPMVVYRKHSMIAPIGDVLFILQIAESIFGSLKIRTNQRIIKDHLHWHLIK
jgi:hypothetical protein